jgi:hypothetical protein
LRWERNKGEFALAKLLRLENENWLYGLDYQFKDGGQTGPILAHPREGMSLNNAADGLRVAALQFMAMAQARRWKAAVLGDLEAWAEALPALATTYPEQREEHAATESKASWEPLAGEVIPADELVEADAAARAVALKIGYQLPGNCTDPDLICSDIRANMSRSAVACLEIGKGLAVLKAACGQGMFIQKLDQIGIERSLSARFMKAAAKFSNVATSQHLLPKIGSQSKLFELLVLDDEQVEELVETGQTGELALDDVACMGVSEMRKKLREVREQVKGKDGLIARREKEIAEKSDELALAQHAARTPDEEAAPGMASRIDEAEADIVQAQKQINEGVAWLYVCLTTARKELGDGPRWRALAHAELEKALGMIRQVAVNIGMPLAMPPADPAIADAEAIDAVWAHVDAEMAAEKHENA